MAEPVPADDAGDHRAGGDADAHGQRLAVRVAGTGDLLAHRQAISATAWA
jgi:hypothetical protein